MLLSLHEAKRHGLKTIAITDHDTIQGLAEAMDAARECGIDIVPAVEFNSDWNDTEVHILAYGIDPTTPWLQEYFADAQEKRRIRVRRMSENLRNIHGFPIYYDDVQSLVGEGVPTRGHINKQLVRVGAVTTAREAHENYTSQGCPAYEPRLTPKADEILSLINRAEAVSVLAHPGRIVRQSAVHELIDLGVEGLECYYFIHTVEQTTHYLELARQCRLLVTGGSDCHGPVYNADGKLQLGTVAVPHQVLPPLLERIAAKKTF